MASSLCLDSTILDAKSEKMSFQWRGNLKKNPKPSEEVLAMLKITSISLVRFTSPGKKILGGKIP